MKKLPILLGGLLALLIAAGASISFSMRLDGFNRSGRVFAREETGRKTFANGIRLKVWNEAKKNKD